MIKKINKRNLWLTICLIIIAALGIFFPLFIVRTETRQIQKNLLEHDRLLVGGIDIGIYSFLENHGDKDSPGYLRLKENFHNVHHFFPGYKSLYLIGTNRDGALFYYIEPVLAENNKEFIRGDILELDSKEIEYVFEKSVTSSKGPYRAGSETAVTLFFPLYDRQINQVIAVLGIDIDLTAWQSILNKKIVLSMVLPLSLILIVLMSWWLLNQRDKVGPKKKRHLFSRHIEVLAIICIGIVVTIFASFFAKNIDSNLRRETFFSLALSEKSIFLHALSDISNNNLESIARFFEGSQYVEPDEFLLFTEYMAENQYIQSWVWVPELAAKEVPLIKTYLTLQGFNDFRIWENDTGNKSDELAIREIYHPILYVNPLKTNSSLIGFNLSSEQKTLDAMIEARESGLITASEPLDLEYGEEVFLTILVFRPVFYEKGSSKTQQGFAGVFLVMDRLLSNLYPSGNSKSDQLNFAFCQLDREKNPEFIASTSQENEMELKDFQQWYYHNDKLGVAVPIFIYGKTYAMLMSPGQAFYRLDPFREGYLVALIGILLTASIAVIVSIINNRQYYLKQQIKLSTYELVISENKYRSLYSNMSEGVALHALSYDDFGNAVDYILLDVNPQFEKITGLKKEKVIGQKASKLYQKSPAPFLKDYADVVKTGKRINFETYYSPLKKYFSISSFSTDKNKFATVFSDITERKKAEKKMKYLSFHDSLTGLYNKAYFDEELKRLNAKRQLPLSIIMADVNGLKFTNDAFGHKEGDTLLVQCAEILKKIFRKEDIIARWGGDEFIILLPKTTPSTTKEIILRIEKECSITENNKIPISISMGFSTKINESQDINRIISNAEKYMYQKKMTDSKSVSSAIISSLKKILNEISNETVKHADRMRKLSFRLGVAFNLPENEIVSLSLLSTLHDIGKIAISRKVLTKPKKLTDSEWSLIKKHPETGYNIAHSSPHLSHISKAILHHHERWDGGGYPHGLKGQEIPITARILSVVDAYDVMTSGRPYKIRMSKVEALAEIKKCSGTQFDPEVVKKFIEILDQ